MNIVSSNLLIDFIKMGYRIDYATQLYAQEEIQNNNLKIINVIPAPEEITFGIITLKNNILSKSCQTFITLIIEKGSNL